ncbi:tigger transposable element-derived protein 6-like [Hydra vulgaris]|uniref:Tigger transposable element-derived protein 6-like n=1 Tax=Hydra vulgaris TaxID=6087 RepID=A0ABM4DBX5_HYDVU
MTEGKGKRLSEDQRVEIIAKLKKSDAPSKRAIAREYNKKNLKLLGNDFKARGFKLMHLFGEGAEVDKDDPVLLQQLEYLYSVIKMYRPENVYNMDETGLFFCLLSRYSLLMPTESLVSIRGSHKIPCSMIRKAARPACIVGRTWPKPYFCQKNAWMDVSIYWKWFNEVFYPEVKNKTGLPVLLLLDNAPGHFEVFEQNLVKVVFFPTNCTSWKQPCDMGIIAALKKRYKYLYLSNILSYYSLNVNTNEFLKESSLLCKRGAAGVEYGKPAHLLDAANKTELLQISSPVNTELCSEEADFASFNMLMLLNEIEGIGNMISSEDIINFESIDCEDSPTYIEAIKDDVEDCLSLDENNDNAVAMDNNSDKEEAHNDKIDDGTDFLGIEFIHLSLIDIGKQLKCQKAKAILKDDNDKLMNSYEQLSSNIRSVIMKIKREKLQNAYQPTIHDFFRHA